MYTYVYIYILIYIYIYILAGGFNPSEKYWSVGMILPNMWKNKQVANQQSVYTYIYIYIYTYIYMGKL